MNLEIQFKIKNNSNYKKYIRENSQWYKILNRAPEAFKSFEEEVKEKYKLRPTDRISKALENLDMIQTIIATLK